MTTATPKADRVPNRAPKGGAVSSVNGRFYRGGWFMPVVSNPVILKPAKLEGSSRQVAWATRLRDQKLAATEAQLTGLIHGMTTIKPCYRPMVRVEIEQAAALRHRLMRTTSAVQIIESARA